MYVCNFQNGLHYESRLTHIYSFSFSRSEHQAYVQFFIVLDDKLLLWSLLMVKIHQPSHEFTFGVGISFIPYPLVLTPVV
jgi:hypothetical protein